MKFKVTENLAGLDISYMFSGGDGITTLQKEFTMAFFEKG